MPSIESGGVEKNLFLITNYLVNKFRNITIITASQNITKFDKKIENYGQIPRLSMIKSTDRSTFQSYKVDLML